jgi:alkylation response protein AidB-like acyl-CoA dehydrogenase
MNLEPNDEQRALRDTVRRYLAEKATVAEHVRPMLDDPTGTTADVWSGLATLGATGLLIPAEYGGVGMTMVDAGVVGEELGAALHPGPWQSSAVTAPRAIARFGVELQASSLLASIADGSVIAAVALPPMNATNPVLTIDPPDATVLRGDLDEVADAAAANVILAIIEYRGDAALFLVDTSSPRVSVTRRLGIDGTRKHFRVTFDDAPAQLLGTASSEAVAGLIDDVLIASAADALGAARTVLDMAVDHAKSRVQFGHPIGSFQSVAHLCVDMYETVELARSGVVHALWAADEADSDERHLAAIRLKGFAARLTSVGDNAIQVLGGIGFTWEHDAHLYLKRLLSWNALLGGPDRYLEEVGTLFTRSVVENQSLRETP